MSLTKVSFSMIDGAFLNVKDFGAAGDGITDDTVAIQTAINAAANANPLYFPPGRYKVTDSLDLYSNTSIFGANDAGLDWRVENLGLSIIELVTADVNKSLFEVSQANLKSGLVWNIAVKNISVTNKTVVGGSGFKLLNVANSYFENVFIEKFSLGLHIINGMTNTFNQVNSQQCGTASFYVEGDGTTTTTQVFNQCVARESDWGWIMPSTATSYSMNTILNNCVIESTKVGGVSLNKSCSATFNDMYCENVPDDREITNGVMFNLHNDGDNTVAPLNSYAIFNGGSLAGGNFGLFSGSAGIFIGQSNYIQINNTILFRCTYGIICDVSTTKANSVYLNAPQFVQVTTPYQNTAGKINGIYPSTVMSTSTSSYASFGWIGAGVTQPESGQVARFQSTTAGLGLPRQTTAQRTNYNPPGGTLVYDTDLQKVYYRNEAGWVAFT